MKVNPAGCCPNPLRLNATQGPRWSQAPEKLPKCGTSHRAAAWARAQVSWRLGAHTARPQGEDSMLGGTRCQAHPSPLHTLIWALLSRHLRDFISNGSQTLFDPDPIHMGPVQEKHLFDSTFTCIMSLPNHKGVKPMPRNQPKQWEDNPYIESGRAPQAPSMTPS